MKHTMHGEYLIQLTRLPHVFPVNAYLVREEDGLTLVDTTLPRSAKAILAAARELGQPIVRIALTHAHGDHVGSLDELHQRLPEAEVLVSARDARFLAGERSLNPDEPQAKLRGSYQTVQTRPTRLLMPGDRVGSLEVVASPGHTPGHIAFWDRRDGTLIAGDAFQTAGGVAVSGTVRLLFPFPAFATWHKPTALTSARVLRQLEPTRLAVGHGAVLEAPASAMDRAIDAAEKIGPEASPVT
jgi:glyoxylase-like metal-dependent hydrolase (beta-lactamase superfamily II)